MRCIPLILCFLVSFAAIGQDFKTQVKLGDAHYGKKEYKQAITAYLQALEINPDDAQVNLKTGMAYLYSETKSLAARYIDKAYRLNPGINDEINYHLGVAFQNTNEFRKAMDQFEQFK